MMFCFHGAKIRIVFELTKKSFLLGVGVMGIDGKDGGGGNYECEGVV
jgi:hypothetical protein